MIRTLLRVLLITALLAVHPASALFAQGNDPAWVERLTPHFTIVYAQGFEADAESYAGFVDQAYTWESGVFKAELDGPIFLRLFPTMESYFRANPVAASVPGVIAHANSAGREIAIALPRAQGLPADDQQNNVRHELAHLFASKLTDDKLPTGFQEGLAQYFEKPTAELDANVELLRQAREQNRLLNWTDLNEPGRAYSDPQVAYPEARSVVAFLVDRYGFARLMDFLKAFTTEPGYRSALESAYGVPADQLESQWQDYLPGYLDARWKLSALYEYDLSREQQLLDEGAYTPAATELQMAIDLLATTDQPEALAHAQAMLQRSQDGQAAHALADSARAALDAGQYDQAAALIDQARQAFDALGDTTRSAELDVYEQRIAAVQDARRRLAAAERQVNSLDMMAARNQGMRLAGELSALGDPAGAQRASAVVNLIDERIDAAGSALLVVATLLLLINAGHRLAVRRKTAQDVETKLL